MVDHLIATVIVTVLEILNVATATEEGNVLTPTILAVTVENNCSTPNYAVSSWK